MIKPGLTLISLPDFSMQAAIFSGLSRANGVQAIDVRCPTTICEWESFKPLWVFSTFTNLTSEISKTSRISEMIPSLSKGFYNLTYPLWKSEYIPRTASVQRLRLGIPFYRPKEWQWPNSTLMDYYHLPNNLYIETFKYNEIRMVVVSGRNRTKSISYKNQTTMLWSIAVLQDTAPIPDTNATTEAAHKFIAYEISLSMCVKEITSRSVNGTLIETVKDVNASVVKGGVPKDKEAPDMNPGMLAQSYEESREDIEFEGGITIAQHSVNGIASTLRTVFQTEELDNTT